MFALSAALASSPAAAVDAALSDRDLAAAIQPVSIAIHETRERLAKLPPPSNDGEKIIRMAELEQAPRAALGKVEFARFSEVQKRQIWTAIAAQMQPIDKANQSALLSMVPPEGWFSISRYGQEAAKAAFLIVQHADQTLWRRFLPHIEKLAKAGEAEGPAYALMYDRLALSEGRPQRYGSQMECREGRYVPEEPLEDPKRIDSRRIALGMTPYAEYLKLYHGSTC
jgi:hypothetical protein